MEAHETRGSPWHGGDPASRESDSDDFYEVQDYEEHELGRRPCVDCGQRTGSWCDCCENDVVFGTPLCTDCEKRSVVCHGCRGQQWCTPLTHGVTAPKGERDTRATLLEQLRCLEPGEEWWRVALGLPGHPLDLDVLRDLLGNAQQRSGPVPDGGASLGRPVEFLAWVAN